MESVFLLLKKMKRMLYFCAFLLAGLSGTQLAYAAMGDHLEVSHSRAGLYAGPSSTSSRIGTLRSGEKMLELERQGGWVMVSVPGLSGSQGWIEASASRKAVRKVARKIVKSTRKKSIKKKKAKKQHSKKNRSVAKKKIIKRTTRSNVSLKAVDDAPVLTPNTPYVTRQVSLKDMGFRKGILLEGATVYHSRVFFFPAPMDSRITHGALRLMFRTSPNLSELANLRVSINDIPYRQVDLSQVRGMNQMDVMLPASAFHGNVVKVTVNAVLPVSDDRCMDDRLNDIFLHILPESALAVSYQPVEKSIRDAWRMLPHHVTLSLSQGQLSQEQFASALAIMAMLADHGKEVRITRLPEVGDIIVAPRQSVEQ